MHLNPATNPSAAATMPEFSTKIRRLLLRLIIFRLSFSGWEPHWLCGGAHEYLLELCSRWNLYFFTYSLNPAAAKLWAYQIDCRDIWWVHYFQGSGSVADLFARSWHVKFESWCRIEHLSLCCWVRESLFFFRSTLVSRLIDLLKCDVSNVLRIFIGVRLVILKNNDRWFITLVIPTCRFDDHFWDGGSGNAQYLSFSCSGLSDGLRHCLGVAAEDYGGQIFRIFLLELLCELLHVFVRVLLVEQEHVAVWFQEIQGRHVWVYFEQASCLLHELIVVFGLDNSLGVILLDRKKHFCLLFVSALRIVLFFIRRKNNNQLQIIRYLYNNK